MWPTGLSELTLVSVNETLSLDLSSHCNIPKYKKGKVYMTIPLSEYY